jgi:sugar-specific transcriptional regulator TrmB
MDTTILEELGLTNSEVKVYISLLELGTSTAGTILEKSQLQNSVVHRALNSLIEKSLISFILEGKRKTYQATNPENFYNFLDDKKKRFDQILPELKKKQQLNKKLTFGEIFKGKRGITQMYTTILNNNGKEYNTFGGGSDVTYNVMGETWWKNLHAKRVEKQIPSRQVFDETIRSLGSYLSKLPRTQIKFLSKDHAQLQETIIFGDCVGIAIFTNNPYGVLIKDKAVADGYRKQFEILWSMAKK